MNNQKFLDGEEYRRDIYELLSKCFFLPDEDLFEKLSSPKAMILLGEFELESNTTQNLDTDLLKMDYTNLFVGPYQLLAPPYGSMYLERSGTIMGASTIDASRMYKDAGLMLNMKEPPDHVAIELEFMYFLMHREVEALKFSDVSGSMAFRQRQAEFLNQHLGTWIIPFSEKIIEYAKTEFYKKIAGLCRSIVIEHRNSLSEELATVVH